MNTCAAVLAGCAAASTLVGESTFTVADVGRIEFEALSSPSPVLFAKDTGLAEAWSVRSMVRVVGADLAFATDHRLFETHDYRINETNDRAGFTSEPGPVNAVEIVLLENLHPQFPDFSSGASIDFFSTSTTEKMTSPRRIAWNAVDGIIAFPTGTPSSGGGSGGNMFRSASGGTQFTDETILPVQLGFGSATDVIYPLDWVSNHGDDSDDTDSNGKLISDSSFTEDVMVVPLPLPMVLTGVGLVVAAMARRRFRP